MPLNNMFVNVGANVEGLSQGMDKAAAKVQSSTLRMSTSLGGLGDAIERVKVPFIALIGVMVGAEVFKNVITGAREAAEQLEILSQKTGLAVSELSQLQYAAKMSDVETRSLDMGLRHLAMSMQQAAIEPTNVSALAFKALGVSIRDVHGNLRPFDELLPEIANKFAAMQDGSGKLALAMALLGRSGGDLIPLFNQGAAGIERFAKEADRLGVTMSQQQVTTLKEYDDEMKRLSAVFDALKREIATAVAPTLIALGTAFEGAGASANHAAGLMGMLEVALERITYIALASSEAIYSLVQGIKIVVAGVTQGLPAMGVALAVAGNNIDNLDEKYANIITKMQLISGGHGMAAAIGKTGSAIAPAVPTNAKEKADPYQRAEIDAVAKANDYLAQNAERAANSEEKAFNRIGAASNKAIRQGLNRDIQDSQKYLLLVTNVGLDRTLKGLDQFNAAQQKAAEAMRKSWLDAFDAISRAVKTSFEGVIQGTITERAAWHNMIRSIELEVIASEERKLAAKAAAWLASKNLSLEEGLKEIAVHAATAAAGAWSALASIPYVGPFLAPAAAAATLAGVLALGKQIASAAGGYDIPAGVNPVTQLHAREMVLPASLAEGVRAMVAGGGAGGGQTHVHHWNVSTMDSKTFAQHMMTNRDALVAPIKAVLREGKV